ncbi:hypothetical protein THOM_1361 [Trachipleistophora hominis]|uniref:Uncharacterized protein n=1 Tax=Trachipleistophora hominis TaxID=72359 RepID=L7JWB0_TRAHO|nr:hypothetical protein THOM_1361 [Trachipleistophora hominis]
MFFIHFLPLILCESDEQPKDNPIQNIAFDKSRKTDGYEAILFFKRDVNPSQISIMGSETPDDDESYTIVKVMDIDSDFEETRNRLHVPLDDDVLMQKGKTYSIQIREDNEIFHSEAFQFDKSSGKFKLSREMKSTGGTKAGWIVGLVLGATALFLVLILIFVRLCR